MKLWFSVPITMIVILDFIVWIKPQTGMFVAFVILSYCSRHFIRKA